MQTKDVGKVWDAVSQYADHIDGFNPWEWLLNESNIALTNSEDDIALFEYIKPGVYFGHYFFWSRGSTAVKAAKDFMKEGFTQYDIKVIQGLTPLDNLAARWMNRKLGFKSLGLVHTHEPCELVLMTKQDWENLYG